ncbi:putative kinetochore protein [Rosellinia necatrix]|uniref:Putative kinetochore protein n=1 Tax=Rosellinia necatrix TaxID=77044 RepID=A0A1W2TVL0_ROSNE|nr:putative kinetochore protein [Rosellinia necatrix]
MDSARKIELQAPEDLAYLIANVRRAAAARIDEAFPPVDDSTEDELRTRIEELVNEYILQTFALAAPNLSINGLPVDADHFLSGAGAGSNPALRLAALEPEEVFEPFDARKRARVEALTAEEEDLLRDIARLKRGVPGAVAAAWSEAARRGVRADEDALESANRRARARFGGHHDNDDDGNNNGNADRVGNGNENGNGNGSDAGAATAATPAVAVGGSAGAGAGVGPGLLAAVVPLDRQDDVEAGFASAVRGLARLKREMPAIVARMERARKAGEYVVTER